MNINKFKEIVTEHWVPVCLTSALALAASLVIAFNDADISTNRFFLEKQSNTAEKVTVYFSKYVENIRRIKDYKHYVTSNKTKITNENIKTLKLYVANRTKARDELFSALDALSLYFNEDTSKAAYAFRNWDEKQSSKKVYTDKDIAEWKKRQRSILLLMHKELIK